MCKIQKVESYYDLCNADAQCKIINVVSFGRLSLWRNYIVMGLPYKTYKPALSWLCSTILAV
jgi:hypothetical protein